jgi:hypothetical protein
MTSQTCADCKAISPETHTHYTLIAKHGWRVVRAKGPANTAVEWRCPACWSVYKGRQTERSSARMRASRPVGPSAESVEAGKMFDRALQALTTKPPKTPRS